MILLYTLSLLGTLLLNSMTLDIVVPVAARAGEAVPIALRLTNTGPRPVTIYLQGRPVAFDVVVTRRDGTPTWRRLHEVVISAILQVRELGPGEVIEFTDTWSQSTNDGEAVPPGDYLVTGILPSDPPAELRTRTAPLRIVP